jgi:hypothetical protein
MKKFVFFFFAFQIFFPPSTVLAEELNFICEGTTEGDDIRTTNDNFSLSIETTNGEMYGMPGFKVPGCMEFEPNRPKISNKLEEREAILNCENEYHITTVRFDRLTAKLTSIHIKKNKKRTAWYGNYQCKKIGKKIF